ncbi:MAG: multicopper oxidase family protein [Pseudomonadota bacterium]
MNDTPRRFSRRRFLAGSASVAALATAGLPLQAVESEPLDLVTRQTSYAFDRPVTEGLVSLIDNAPPPVIRMRQAAPFVVNLTNGLSDYTTMHWHGIRLANAMDGVPYLTQFPLAEGDSFRYAFTPPDAGTYWYHPHCMTMSQMAHGLTGILIVEEPDDPGFDTDLPINLKDFRLDDDGQLLPFFTPRGAARAGTLGNVRTANWQIDPVHELPAGGLVRLRIVATDTTRVYKLVLPDAPGTIIAWDGHPVDEPIAWPSEESPMWLGPGQRVDVALRMPDDEGSELTLQTMIANRPNSLARLRSVGPSLKRDLAELKPLARNPVAEPDLASAETREMVFGWTPEGDGEDNGFCGNYGYSFWSIDRQPWPGDAVEGVGPVADLTLGKSYVLRLRNESPNLHPIHLHGLAFVPIQSNQRQLPRNWTDTILLLKNETIDIALKADNLGDWAFHCHVIEHQKTGLAGYIRVS